MCGVYIRALDFLKLPYRDSWGPYEGTTRLHIGSSDHGSCWDDSRIL